MNHLHHTRLPYVPRGLRVGLLGGSFNPAHAGHLALSLFALRRFRLDAVWWLVAPQNPLKSAYDMAPLATRLAGATALARHPRIKVLAPEAAWGCCYTVDMLHNLRQIRAGGRFVLLLGSDNWVQLPRWRHWRRIMGAVPVAVLRRDAYAGGLAGACEASACYAFARRHPTDARNLATQTPPVWIMADNPRWAISATRIRQQQRDRSAITWPPN
ncbi:MAG: nicotinate-nucleotide adenylyltransferase [Hyphomicrobium sp.]